MTPAELKKNLQVLPREYATWEDIPKIYREVNQLLIEIGADWHDTLPDICGGWLQARILIRIMNLYKIKEIPYDETIKGRKNKFRLVREKSRIGQLLTTKQIQKEFREQKNQKREISTIQKYIKDLRKRGLLINCNKGSKQYLYHFPMTENIRGKLKKREREIYSLSEKSNDAVSKVTKSNNREPKQTSKKITSKPSIGDKYTANGKNSVCNKENTSTRLNSSSQNTSYSSNKNYNNNISSKSVKLRLKLRKNKK